MHQTQALLIAVLIVLAVASFWVTWALRTPMWRVSSTYADGSNNKFRAGQGLWEACALKWSTASGQWSSVCSDLTKSTLEASTVDDKAVRYTELQIARVASVIASIALFVGVVLAIAGVAAHKNGHLHLATTIFAGLAFVAAVVAIATYATYAAKKNTLVVRNQNALAPQGKQANANHSYGSAYAGIIIGAVLAIPAFVMVLVAALKAMHEAKANDALVSVADASVHPYSPDIGVSSTESTHPSPAPVK